jgi:hypothetical protein
MTFSLVQTTEVEVTRHERCIIRVTVVERGEASRNATGEGPAGRVVMRSLVVTPVPLVLAGYDYRRR